MSILLLNSELRHNLFNLIKKPHNSKIKIYEAVNKRQQRNYYIKSKLKVDYGKYFLLTIPITTFCLGIWQVERRKWKIELLETIHKRRNQIPQPLPNINSESELAGLEYANFLLVGEFDHDLEVVLTPRSNVEYADRPTSNVDNLSGGHVVTPFNLQDGRRILVNRGWVKRSQIDPSTRKEGQVKGTVTLTGVLRLSEKRRGQIQSHVEPRHWHKRVHEDMAFQLGTLPILLDAVKESTVPGGPIGGQTRLVLRNEHWQYIITWFSISACTAVLWVKKYLLK